LSEEADAVAAVVSCLVSVLACKLHDKPSAVCFAAAAAAATTTAAAAAAVSLQALSEEADAAAAEVARLETADIGSMWAADLDAFREVRGSKQGGVV
jgi:hypothetical protein